MPASKFVSTMREEEQKRKITKIYNLIWPEILRSRRNTQCKQFDPNWTACTRFQFHRYLFIDYALVFSCLSWNTMNLKIDNVSVCVQPFTYPPPTALSKLSRFRSRIPALREEDRPNFCISSTSSIDAALHTGKNIYITVVWLKQTELCGDNADGCLIV